MLNYSVAELRFIFKEPDRQIVLVELQFLISATCGTNKKRYMGYLLFTK